MKLKTALHTRIKRLTRTGNHSFVVSGKAPETGKAVFNISYKTKKGRNRAFTVSGKREEFHETFQSAAEHIRSL